MTKDKAKELFGNDWGVLLKGFLCSKEFDDILSNFKGVNTIPDKKYAFNAFKLCPLAEVNTIILSVAGDRNDDGLAFSSRYSDPTIQSEQFWKELRKFEDIETPCYDLSYLADQGILLLNLDLVKMDGQKTIDSIRIWEPFFNYLFNIIKLVQMNSERHDNNAYHLTVALVGKQAHKYFDEFIPGFNDVYKLDHPLAVKGDWDSKGIFERITNITQFLHSRKIIWNENNYKYDN